MKLKKVLSGIMAAVMAVTSSVVISVSAAAEETTAYFGIKGATTGWGFSITPEKGVISTGENTYTATYTHNTSWDSGGTNFQVGGDNGLIFFITDPDGANTVTDITVNVSVNDTLKLTTEVEPTWTTRYCPIAAANLSGITYSYSETDVEAIGAIKYGDVVKFEVTCTYPVDEREELTANAYDGSPITMSKVYDDDWCPNGTAQGEYKLTIPGVTYKTTTYAELKAAYKKINFAGITFTADSLDGAASDYTCCYYVKTGADATGWGGSFGSGTFGSAISMGVNAMGLADDTIIGEIGIQVNMADINNLPAAVDALAEGATFTINAPAPATYEIKAGEAIGGTISFADAEGTAITEAAKDDIVTVKVTPADGYKLDGFTTDVTITEAEGVYTFEMPAEAVTITPVFEAITVDAIEVKAAATSVVVGGTTTVTATVTPEDALNKAVTWASDKTAVATVDENGKVTAISEGEATITATAKDGSGKTGSVKITVTADENPATAIALDKAEASIKMDETVTLTATVTAKDTTKDCTDSVTWKSSDEKIATVKDGKVTPVALGTATITVTAGEQSATCKITVAATPVEKITLAADSTTITVGNTATVTATVTPDDATDKTVTWTSSDTSVATVADGKVTAVTAGKATITATAKDGSKITGTIDITVEEAPAELADPVLPDVKYGEIVTTKSGEFTFANGSDGSLNTSLLQLQTAATNGTTVFNEDDILMLAITTDVATATDKENGWQMAFNGFTGSWGGWSAACSDKGTLTYYATVADVMKANKMTSISELGGVIFQVWGGNVGDSLKYVLAHATAPAADEEEDETLDKGTYGAGTGSYKEIPANEIPQMTMGKDNVETEGYTETSKAYFEDDKLFIFQCVDEAALEGKSQATVVVQHKNGKALKMTSTGVYKTLKADVPAEDGKLYVAFVISGVTNDVTADAYYGNFQWSDITIS